MYKRLVSYCFLLISGLILTSCLKELPEELPAEPTWNPEVAFPVGETSLGMNAASGFDTLLLNMNDSTGYPYWVENIDIPIEGSTSFNFSTLIGTSEQINRIMIRVNAKNEFPAAVLLQAYFIESDGFVIESFFSDEGLILNPGKINNLGEAVSPSYTRKDVVFSSDRINNMENAESISFKAIIQNVEIDSTLIEFYPDYSIDIQLGAMLDLIIE